MYKLTKYLLYFNIFFIILSVGYAAIVMDSTEEEIQETGFVSSVRDYGGRICIGCGPWYVKNGEYLNASDVIDWLWTGGYDGAYLLNASEIDSPFSLELKPYVVTQDNSYYTIQQIKNAYPNVQFSQFITQRNDYKWGINISAIPSAAQADIKFIAFQINNPQNLIWNDVVIDNSMHRIVIKDTVEMRYSDLIDTGFTLNIYNKSVILVGNVTGKEELFLDPSVTLNSSDDCIDDGYVSEDSDVQDSGTGRNLQIDSRDDQAVYIKYNISSLAGKTVTEANLSIYHESYEFDGDLEFYHVFNNGTWDESTLNWTNQPCDPYLSGASGYCNTTKFLTVSIPDGESDVWRVWNVTYPIKQDCDWGNNESSFVFEDDGDVLMINYYRSSEETESKHRHYLTVAYEDGATTTTTTTTTTSTTTTTTSTSSTTTSTSSTTSTTTTTTSTSTTTTTTSTTSTTSTTTTTTTTSTTTTTTTTTTTVGETTTSTTTTTTTTTSSTTSTTTTSTTSTTTTSTTSTTTLDDALTTSSTTLPVYGPMKSTFSGIGQAIPEVLLSDTSIYTVLILFALVILAMNLIFNFIHFK